MGVPDVAVFLDFGDVISDTTEIQPQWDRLIGRYYSTRFGGAPEEWVRANRQAYEGFLQAYAEAVWGRTEAPFNAFHERAWLQFAVDLFEFVRLEPPPAESRFDEMLSAQAWITERIRAPLPGAVDAVFRLDELRYRLYTCSGHASISLRGYLRALGIEHLFRRHYGPDLVDRAKQGSVYFRRILEDSGEDPSKSVIVEDKASVLRWAAETGANCVKIGKDDEESENEFIVLDALAELPEALERLF